MSGIGSRVTSWRMFGGITGVVPRGNTSRASVSLALFAVVALVAAGCGGSSSKPAYCSDRSTLQSDVQGLSVPTSSSDISSLQSQLTTIQSDATALVNSAKSDFPSETSAIKLVGRHTVQRGEGAPVEPVDESDRRDRG